MESLDIRAAVKATPELLAAARALGDEVGRLAHGQASESVLAGAVVVFAKLKNSRLFLGFHLDEAKTSGSKNAYLALHVGFRPIPTSRAPAEVVRLQKAGYTVESISERLESMLAGSQVYAQVAVDGHVADITGMTLVGGPPLLAGDDMLEGVGAEYRRVSDELHDGVKSFRWRRRPAGGIKVWLSHEFHGEWIGAKPWLSEHQRAEHMLANLL